LRDLRYSYICIPVPKEIITFVTFTVITETLRKQIPGKWKPKIQINSHADSLDLTTSDFIPVSWRYAANFSSFSDLSRRSFPVLKSSVHVIRICLVYLNVGLIAVGMLTSTNYEAFHYMVIYIHTRSTLEQKGELLLLWPRKH